MLALLVSLASGCSGPADPAAARDTGGADSAPGADTGDTTPDSADTADLFCAGAPTLAWSNFGQGFLLENCQGCHASTAVDRYGAPEGVVFDTVEDAWLHAPRILARSTGDAPTMPPQGGVSADDRTRLEWWLRCGTPGT